MVNVMTCNHIVGLFLQRVLRIVQLSIIHIISGKVRVLNLEDVGATGLPDLVGKKFARETADSLSAVK